MVWHRLSSFSKVGDSTHPSQSQNPVVMREKITLSKVDLSKLKR